MEKRQARSFNFLVPGVGIGEFSTPNYMLISNSVFSTIYLFNFPNFIITSHITPPPGSQLKKLESVSEDYTFVANNYIINLIRIFIFILKISQVNSREVLMLYQYFL